MKAKRLMCHGIRKIEVEEFELEALSDDGILVQNDFTAVSVGTELWNWKFGANPGDEATFPRVTGYCNTGMVLEVGKNVMGIKPGDRVAGRGSHASHAVMRKSNYDTLYHLVPEGTNPKSAVFLNMAAIAMHGIRVGKIELGEAVAITGVGVVGQLALTLAKLSGALPVIAIDVDEFRLEKAKARGADFCLNPDKVENIESAIREYCVEDGANCVIEATGIPGVYPMAVKLACTAGRLISLGSPRGTIEFNFLDEVHLREVAIYGAIQPITPEQANIYFWWTKDRERNFLLRLMAEKKLSAADLITHIAKPEQCHEIFTMLADHPMENNALGVVFDWN